MTDNSEALAELRRRLRTGTWTRERVGPHGRPGPWHRIAGLTPAGAVVMTCRRIYAPPLLEPAPTPKVGQVCGDCIGTIHSR